MFLIRRVDFLLNKLTMYRLLIYGLAILLAIGILLSSVGRLSLSAPGLITSLIILLPVCYLSNRVISDYIKAPRSTESWLVTALILCCIMPPTVTLLKAVALAVVGLIAMASKYVLAIWNHHLFNPAAVAAVIVGLVGLTYARWWVGSPEMLPFTLLLGLLIARKSHRLRMVFVFLVVATAVALFVGLRNGEQVGAILSNAFGSSPLIFFGFIMLTEPATMPSTNLYQLLYAGLVGALFSAQLRFGLISTTPENVLIVGNLFTFFVTPKRKLKLTLKARHQLTPQTYDFVFEPDHDFDFKAGQYVEWTLPHKKVDSRGNRRSFTIASSPTENNIHLGVKFYQETSSFKRALLEMKPGDTMAAGQLSGDFCLPADEAQKLVFVAGGIGFTPFRSMLKYMMDSKQKRDVTLIYVLSSAHDLAYREFIEDAEAAIGLKVVYVVSKGELPVGKHGYLGRLTADQVKKAIPDYKDRTYYVSGPNTMVEAYTDLLTESGVSRLKIVTDYFSGY